MRRMSHTYRNWNQARVKELRAQMAAAAWSAIYARFTSQSEQPQTDVESKHGWPGLNETQQADFQKWYAAQMQKKKDVLMPKLKQLDVEVEEAISAGESQQGPGGRACTCFLAMLSKRSTSSCSSSSSSSESVLGSGSGSGSRNAIPIHQQ